MSGTSASNSPNMNDADPNDVRVEGVTIFYLYYISPTSARMYHGTHDSLFCFSRQYEPLISPLLLRSEVPVSSRSWATIRQARRACAKVISRKDDRLIVIVGPCSIHGTCIYKIILNPAEYKLI